MNVASSQRGRGRHYTRGATSFASSVIVSVIRRVERLHDKVLNAGCPQGAKVFDGLLRVAPETKCRQVPV
jgi:hypothetical protein